jgi:hypothetical protein
MSGYSNTLNILFISLTSLITPLAFAECGKNLNTSIQRIIDKDRLKYHMPGIEVTIR